MYFSYLIERHSKFLLHTLQVLYMCTLWWFYKHQNDNRVRSTQNAFSLPFAALLVNCAPSGEMHYYCTPHIIKENSENFLIHRCNYILLSQVYCVWQIVKTPTIILNNPVYLPQFLAGVEPSWAGGLADSLLEVLRAGCLFCFVSQSDVAVAVQDTRS